MNIKGWIILILFLLVSMTIVGLVLPILPFSMGQTVILMVLIMIMMVILTVTLLGIIKLLGAWK